MLEAGRWAPSAGNSQPWAFILGCRGKPEHERLVQHLAKSVARWGPTAGLLVTNLSHRFVEDTYSDYSEFSVYDLGQALAHTSFQAQAMGLHVRQFRAFDRPGWPRNFQIPSPCEVTTMSAVGHLRPDAAHDDQANVPARRRRFVHRDSPAAGIVVRAPIAAPASGSPPVRRRPTRRAQA